MEENYNVADERDVKHMKRAGTEASIQHLMLGINFPEFGGERQ